MVTTIPQTTDLEQSLADTAPPPDYAAPHNAPPPAESAEASPIEFDAPPTGASVDMPLARLVPATYNPRRTFDEDALRELADSIRMHGLLEPIVVREITMPTDLVRVTDADGNTCPTFEVIAGARRCRACRLAGLDLVPVRVLTGVDDRRALQLAIVENLQRVDLDPIEQAQGYAALRDQAGMRQTAIAAAVKRSQTAIARSLGLLNLPDDVQELVRTGQLTAAHGAALERFSEFPAYVRAVADLAMRANWTSKRLAEEKLPVSYEMWKRNGVMRSLGHQAAFDVEVCKSCPFGAYRHAEYAQAYCLKPEHYDQLQADAQALAKAAAVHAPSGLALVDAAADAAKGVELPQLQALSSGSYETLYGGTIPPGCTADCTCRGQARSGDRIVTICTDPKCLHRLRLAETKARNKARREEAQRKLTAVVERIDTITALDSGVLAAILLQLEAYRLLKAWVIVGTRRNDPDLADAFNRRDYAKLATFNPVRLASFVLEALITNELADAAEGGYVGTATYDRYTTYIETLPEPATALPDSPLNSEPQQPCAFCGRPTFDEYCGRYQCDECVTQGMPICRLCQQPVTLLQPNADPVHAACVLNEIRVGRSAGSQYAMPEETRKRSEAAQRGMETRRAKARTTAAQRS